MTDNTSFDAPTLHELMRQANADWGSGKDIAWRDWVRKLLDEGALPNEIDEHEMSPLAILVDSGIGNSTAYTDGVELMIERGGNPLINDRALGKAAASASIGPDGGLAGAMLRAIIREETRGRSIRSETGENALHVLCADAPEWVANVLEAPGACGMGEERIPKQWLQEADNEGNLPLHAMWREGGIIFDRLEADMDVDNEVGAWASTQAMIDAGAEPLARNGNRETVANLILACVEMGMPTEEDVWPAIEAITTHERLDRDTGAARKPGGGIGRL